MWTIFLRFLLLLWNSVDKREKFNLLRIQQKSRTATNWNAEGLAFRNNNDNNKENFGTKKEVKWIANVKKFVRRATHNELRASTAVCVARCEHTQITLNTTKTKLLASSPAGGLKIICQNKQNI